ncbi:MAG: putative signal transduction protein with domain [Hyphomicrobiales bacterium]|nr:putative signal transduction protein with domain [Hyphomicrobiales bacterium]
MTVGRILAAKGRDVVTIEPHRTIADAAELLARRSIGAIVVTDHTGAVRGIVSERDIVRMLSSKGPGALKEDVAAWMTQNVVTTREGTTVPSLMEQMTTGRFRHIPVVEEGRLVGIVSIGDVVKHRLAEMETEQKALREYIATA